MTRPGVGKKLLEEQELAVCHYLDRLDKIETAAKRPMLVHCANTLLRLSHKDQSENPPTVGQNWAKRFLARHPEYSIRKQKTLDVERKNAHDPKTIQDWFDGYTRLVLEKGITATDTYNVDETGFRMVIGQNQWIITRDHSRQSYLASSGNREFMTCIKTISGDGGVLPLMFIFSGTQHMEHWFSADLPDEILFAVSETGYTNDELGLD